MKYLVLSAAFLTATTWLSNCSGARAHEEISEGTSANPTGTAARIAENERVVVIEDDAGKVLFEVDVIGRCGEPAVGSPVVREVEVVDGVVSVVFGKHDHASIDLATGMLECLGSD